MHIDRASRPRQRIAGVQQSHDLTVVADKQAGEMLQMPGCIDLNAIGMIDKRVGQRR
jgi:hypothetical protein